MSREVTVLDAIEKLVGNVEWYGETHHDNEVADNLQEVAAIMYHYSDKLYQINKVLNSHPNNASAKMLHKIAKEIAKEVRAILDVYEQQTKERSSD